MSASEIKFAYVKYSTGEKEIVSVDRIKGFNATNIHYEKKYKILWNEDYYDGIIIFVAETEKALESKINKNRPRLRPMDLYLSASESDTGHKVLKENNNINREKNKSEKEQLLCKKLKDLPKHKQNTTTSDVSTEKYKHEKKELLDEKLKNLSERNQNVTTDYQERKRFKKEVENLKRRIAELKLSLQNKDAITEDLTKANLALQKNVIEEIKELKNMITEHKKKENQEPYNETSFPVGYRREIDNNIHIGRNIWISSQVYDSAVCISKSPSTFTKNMALAIFGAQILKESTVTGIISNRIKGKRTEAPRPKLDEKRLLALKDIVRYWLHTVKKYDEFAIDLEINLVGKHVSQKIYELNRKKNKQTIVNNNDPGPSTREALVIKEKATTDVASMDNSADISNETNIDEDNE